VTDETIQLNLPSRIDSIAKAAEAAAEAARRAGLNDDAAFGLDMAVREAVTNAVLHGNRQDESKLVELTFEETTAALSVTVRDQGTGFDLASIPDPTDAQNLLKASGRGILFMRNFMDTVEWEPHPAGGTVVRMTKQK
jgi:serine/threonine-protein kinase RsbW